MDLPSLYPLLLSLSGTAITTGLGYVIYLVRRIDTTLERHERVLFGDANVSEWEGLVRTSVNIKKHEMINRESFLALVQILISSGVINPDDDVKQMIDNIKHP